MCDGSLTVGTNSRTLQMYRSSTCYSSCCVDMLYMMLTCKFQILQTLTRLCRLLEKTEPPSAAEIENARLLLKQVPYSLHNSFEEMQAFVAHLRPLAIAPIVTKVYDNRYPIDPNIHFQHMLGVPDQYVEGSMPAHSTNTTLVGAQETAPATVPAIAPGAAFEVTPDTAPGGALETTPDTAPAGRRGVSAVLGHRTGVHREGDLGLKKRAVKSLCGPGGDANSSQHGSWQVLVPNPNPAFGCRKPCHMCYVSVSQMPVLMMFANLGMLSMRLEHSFAMLDKHHMLKTTLQQADSHACLSQ